MLLHIPEVLSREELAELRQALDGADWTDGRETVGVQGAPVKRNEQLADALPLRVLPPRFNRYRDGGNYGFHVDGSVMRLGAQGGGAYVRSDVSCTLFLNAPEEYEGGELVVADTYGEHRIRLPAGDMVLYPSSSLHQVTPVTRGARLASFFWVQSMVRDAERRRLLFEMDTSIETLRRSGADAAAVLRLTGVYHNLLRGWAEV